MASIAQEMYLNQESEKLLDDSLKSLSEEEIIALSKSWMEVGTYAVFENPGIRGQLKRVGQLMSGSSFSSISGSAFGTLEAFSGIAGGIKKYKKLKTSTDKSNLKKFYIAMDIINSTQIISRTAILTTAKLAVLGAGIAPLIVLAAGAVFAAMMWTATVASMIELSLTIKKRDDPTYLFADRVKRYADAKDDHSKEVFKNQALAILRVHRDKFTDDDLNEFPDLGSKEDLMKLGAVGATKEEKDIVSILEQRQHDKVIARTFNTAQWFLAASAMTLIALSPVCPYLMIPGLALAGISIAIRVGQVLVSKIGNYIARKQMEKELEKNITDSPEHLAYLQMVKNHPDKKINESEFKEAINNLSDGRKNRLLKAARERTIDDMILQKAVGDNYDQLVTKKSRKTVVHQFCRSQFKWKDESKKERKTSDIELKRFGY